MSGVTINARMRVIVLNALRFWQGWIKLTFAAAEPASAPPTGISEQVLRAEPDASHDVRQRVSRKNGVTSAMTPVQESPDIRFFFASLSQHRVASIAGLSVRVDPSRSSFIWQTARCRSKPLG